MRCAVILVSCLAMAGCAADVEARSGLGARLAPATEPAEPVAYRGGGPVGVTAESRYGHGRVSGPVRESGRGRLEVRMPGGTWIECGRSCSDTLRRETVDFWENHGGRNGTVDGPGYFRW